MSLSYPLDILAGFPGWTTVFDLSWRQEQSRQANGVTRVKDLGSPLWSMTATTKPLSPNTLDLWRAKLDALENGLQIFKGYHLSRTYPIRYPNGSWGAFSGSATLLTVGGDNKSIALSGLPSGFALQPGDMLQLRGTDLHRVMEAASANGAGQTGSFEVRPHLWPGLANGVPALLLKPWCPMAIVPGSIQSTADLNGRGAITFQAMEART